MRLLERGDTGEFRLTKNLPNDAIPSIPYAILSHTWGKEEVLFRDLVEGTAKRKKEGYAKIQFCGDQACRDGLNYFWVDTCCIDKSDAAELQHALNSMFRWYRWAKKCYVYLSDVSTYSPDDKSSWVAAFQTSKWFTRGWTLQELIAPITVEFFCKEGKRLGDKSSLEQQIFNITGIQLGALRGGLLSDFSIDERMAWVRRRNTTYQEDKAYCLLGIFDVYMPLLYGEGEAGAFARLREKISKNFHRLADLRSVNPRLEKERIEAAKGGLIINAYRSTFESLDLDRWRRLPESRMLWIRGDPGKGKTMLVCGIINELERAIIASGHYHNLAYFFCQATDSQLNSATAVLRGLIYLLVHRQPRLISHLSDDTYPLKDATAWIFLTKVLDEMLRNPDLKMTYLVVDALDECVTDLHKLLKLVICTSSERVKWLVSSRNQKNIEKELQSSYGLREFDLGLETNTEHVSRDLDGYLDDKLSCLASIQYNIQLKGRVRDILRQKADGIILWASLVLQELSKDEVESWHILPIVDDLPQGLNYLYERMLKEIDRHRWDSGFCRSILSMATVADRPLHLTEIGHLSGLPEQILKSTENVRKIVAKCGSFLTVQDDQIYLVHQSAKDYLSTSRLLFPCGTGILHHDMFIWSLDLMSDKLRRNIYGLEAPGFPINKVQTPPLPRKSFVEFSINSPQKVDQAFLDGFKASVKKELEVTRNLLLKTPDITRQEDFRIVVNAQTIRIHNGGGQPLVGLPKISLYHYDAIGRLVDVLKHAARFQAIKELRYGGPAALHLLAQDCYKFRAYDLEGEPISMNAAGQYMVTHGQRVNLVFEPAPGSGPLYVNIFNLAVESWAITKMFPPQKAAPLQLQYPEKLEIDTRMQIPTAADDDLQLSWCTDIIRAYVYMGSSLPTWDELQLQKISGKAVEVRPNIPADGYFTRDADGSDLSFVDLTIITLREHSNISASVDTSYTQKCIIPS